MCCQVLARLPALRGIAASSVLIQRYSAVSAVMPVDARCVSHQDRSQGSPPYTRHTSRNTSIRVTAKSRHWRTQRLVINKTRNRQNKLGYVV